MSKQSNITFQDGLAKGIKTTIRLWAGWNPRRILSLWKRSRIFKHTTLRRTNLLEKQNITVPPLIIFSPTMQCNFSCNGCYSRNYPDDEEMTLEEIKVLFQEAEDLGVGFFVITGGEPLLRDGLMDLLSKHKKLIFLLFTNGSNITRSWAKRVGQMNNVVPILSVEGNEKETNQRRGDGVYQQVIESMKYLNEAKAFFGFSAMVTTHNISILGEITFYDNMIKNGCRIGFCVGYVPTGPGADFNKVPTTKQQSLFRKRILYFQQNKPLILIHLPDDEYKVAGTCMAAARGFLHINAQGYVEPCPFSHIASDTIRNKSLKEVLQAPLFTYIRESTELLKKPHLGCALFENREKLKKVAHKLGAKSTENINPSPC